MNCRILLNKEQIARFQMIIKRQKTGKLVKMRKLKKEKLIKEQPPLGGSFFYFFFSSSFLATTLYLLGSVFRR